jgi:hypothetical protein
MTQSSSLRTNEIANGSRGLLDEVAINVQHTGSALFSVPYGIAKGEYVGQALFA